MKQTKYCCTAEHLHPEHHRAIQTLKPSNISCDVIQARKRRENLDITISEHLTYQNNISID